MIEQRQRGGMAEVTEEEFREILGVLEPKGTYEDRRDAQTIELIHYTRLRDEATSETRKQAMNRVIGVVENKLIENETRNNQVEDLTKLQKFKRWAKENLAGLSAVAIAVAGIITTVVVGARRAVMRGAQATSKFAKAVANLGKKLWPFLAPIFSLLSTILSWGAKAMAWLTQNL